MHGRPSAGNERRPEFAATLLANLAGALDVGGGTHASTQASIAN